MLKKSDEYLEDAKLRLLEGKWKEDLSSAACIFERKESSKIFEIIKKTDKTLFEDLISMMDVIAKQEGLKQVFDASIWSAELYKAIEGLLFAHFVRLDVLYGNGDAIQTDDFIYYRSYERGKKSRKELADFYEIFKVSSEVYHATMKVNQVKGVIFLLKMAQSVYDLKIKEEIFERGTKRKR